ncbi:MAG: response regulator [Lachnospiraceae bacterium]|nr:response regulator [Lachnospiraceae bacterium]
MRISNNSKSMVLVKTIFFCFTMGIFLYWILGQILLPVENRGEKSEQTTFSDGWVWIKEDGTKEEIQIPGKCDVARNELMVIENTIPDYVEDNIYLYIRSSKQELKVYVDGVLRHEYTTKDTRLFGKVSAVAWTPVKLKSADAGKTIRMELQTDSSYSGVFHEIYYGDKWDIWEIFFKQYGVEFIISIFMIFLSVVSIIISVALRIVYKKNIELEYLGWAILLAAVWILSNSVFRQVLFPSISVISDMAFFMVMLLPIPFMLYLNCVQHERYEKAYTLAIALNLADSFVCTILHITNLVDFSDTIKYMAVFCVLSIALMGFTLIRDVFTGQIKEYKLIAVSIAMVAVLSMVQLVIYFTWTNQFTGSFIAIGLVVVLINAFINTMRDILKMEKEKQQAVLSSEAKGKFLANMSHEIRTPINAVLGMDAMILRESTEENIKEYAINIQNAGQTLLSLINDILDFSKIESGKMEIVPVEYDFSSMIHDAVNMILMKATNKGLETNISVEKTLPYRLLGDEVRIRQILVNLLTNAVKYTKEGSISLSVSGHIIDNEVSLTFTVEDTGIGIKEEDIAKLFARFERIEEEKNRNIEGTGLGMSITMQLLKLMDSELKVESEYGKGSRFSFTLKQWIVDSEPIGDLEERIRKHPSEYRYSASFTAPDAHILVVDDNAINRDVFIGLLKQTKVKIDDADSGKECLDKVKERHYDLIFLDHMMPDMDGVETLHHMKELGDYPCSDTPVIALTANAIQGAREMYLKEGFNEFLAKPIQPEKLEKMIVDMLPEELVHYEEETVESDVETDVQSDAQSDAMPEIEGIDWQIALEHCYNQETLMGTVYGLYTTIDEEADYLEQYYEQLRDKGELAENYRIKVHSMKSSAALIGAMKLSEDAKELENAARNADVDTIISKTPKFLEQWRSYKEKLAICVEEEEKKQIEDVSEVLNDLQALQEAMENLDVDVADELMKKLQQYQYTDEINSKVEKLAITVVNLDSEGASALIEELRQEL